MRVEPPLVYSGSFWLPATPDRALPGTLSIEDGGKSTLEIVGRLDTGHPLKAPSEYERIIGEVIQDGHVTLEHCYLTASGYHGSGAPYKHKVEPSLAIIGNSYGDKEPVLFDELRFSIEGLDEWLAITGLKASWLAGVSDKMSIEFTPPAKRELWKSETFSLWCEFDWSAPTTALKSAAINQSAFLRLRSIKPVTLNDFTKWVHQLGHLVAFAMDANVSIYALTAYANGIRRDVGTKFEKMLPLPIYYESLTFTAKKPELREIDRLFKLEELPVSSQAALDAWFRFHAINKVAANLYFTTRKTKFEYLNIQFILMAQAAEVYHRNFSDEKLMSTGEFRKLKKQIVDSLSEVHRKMINEKLAHGNDLTLAHRLERLMAPFDCFFGDAAMREITIKSIVGTRNHYIHWGSSDDRDQYGGLNLWTNLIRIDILMQMQLLNELGYSIKDIVRILEKNLTFQRHQHLLKQAVAAEPPPL